MTKEEQIKEIETEIKELEAKVERLSNDNSKVTMMWAGSTYNHGPYLRRLEKNKAKAKIKRRKIKLSKLIAS